MHRTSIFARISVPAVIFLGASLIARAQDPPPVPAAAPVHVAWEGKDNNGSVCGYRNLFRPRDGLRHGYRSHAHHWPYPGQFVNAAKGRPHRGCHRGCGRYPSALLSPEGRP
jgi:hypothetical protein